MSQNRTKGNKSDKSGRSIDTATPNIESRPAQGKSVLPYTEFDPNRNRKYCPAGNIGKEVEIDVWGNDVNKGQVGEDLRPREFGKHPKRKPK